MKLWPQRKVVLHSPLSPNECVAALAAAIDVERWSWLTWSHYAGVKAFVGKIIGLTFRIQKRSPWYWRNQFAPSLYGEIVSTPAGTEIRGSFDFYPPLRTPLRIWVLIVAAVTGLELATAAMRSGLSAEMLGVLPIAAFLFLPTLARLLTRRQERILLAFLETTLHARIGSFSKPSSNVLPQ